jgi:hypothetical protein
MNYVSILPLRVLSELKGMMGWSYPVGRYNKRVFQKLVIWKGELILHDNLDKKNYRKYTTEPSSLTFISWIQIL